MKKITNYTRDNHHIITSSNHLIIVFLFFCFSTTVFAQEKKPKGEPINIYYDEEMSYKDITWKQNGFEFFIGGGAYFGGRKTANYYNGAPENNINLNLIFNNPYYWKEADFSVMNILRHKYPYMDTAIFDQKNGYNYKSKYNIAMDIALGVKYRFMTHWYVELTYSFRRLTCDNRFAFEFPNGVPGNKDYPPYSKWQHLLAKEDRHYIDISVGYILQKHRIVKPFIAVGGLFTYIDIKSFSAFIESSKPNFDLISLAKNPDYTLGVPTSPGNNYKYWRGPGYGCSLTVGLKIVAHRVVSLDPVFQLSVASFGNSKNLPGFNNNMCFSYMAGVRLVMNDALFTRNQ